MRVEHNIEINLSGAGPPVDAPPVSILSRPGWKMKMILYIIGAMFIMFLVGTIGTVSLVSAEDWAIDIAKETDNNEWSVDINPGKGKPTNLSTTHVNSSDFWDNLDTPADITNFVKIIGDTMTGKLNIQTGGGSGASANPLGNDLVIDSNTFAGLSILTPNDSIAFINFGDTEDNNVGILGYLHSTDVLNWRSNGLTRMQITPTEMTVLSDLNVTGNATAQYYFGDGSQLTNLPSGGSGNPFDQSLNTTDNVIFNSVNVTEFIEASPNLTTQSDIQKNVSASPIRINSTLVSGDFVPFFAMYTDERPTLPKVAIYAEHNAASGTQLYIDVSNNYNGGASTGGHYIFKSDGTFYSTGLTIENGGTDATITGNPSTGALTIDSGNTNAGGLILRGSGDGINIGIDSNIYQEADNQKYFLGAGDDASITYNGTHMLIDSQEVGTGDLLLNVGGGNVGIGTAPSTTLHLNTAGTTVMRIDTTGDINNGRALFQMLRNAGGVANGWDFGYNIDLSSDDFIIREITGGDAFIRFTISNGTGKFKFNNSNADHTDLVLDAPATKGSFLTFKSGGGLNTTFGLVGANGQVFTDALTGDYTIRAGNGQRLLLGVDNVGSNNDATMSIEDTEVKILNDNAKLLFGAADDEGLYFNGSDSIDNAEVGSQTKFFTGFADVCDDSGNCLSGTNSSNSFDQDLNTYDNVTFNSVNVTNLTVQDTFNFGEYITLKDSPFINDGAIGAISGDVDGLTGVNMRNINTGLTADFRFSISDVTGHYLAFAVPGINNNQTLLGQNRSESDFLFNSEPIGGTSRDLTIGTFYSTDLIFGINNSEVARFKDLSFGLLTSTPLATLDVSQGGRDNKISLLVGADLNQVTRTNNVRKFSRVAAPHYETAEEPMGIFVSDSDGTDNTLNFGGGSGLLNSATKIKFITGASDTTTSGTERVQINSNGDLKIVADSKKLLLGAGDDASITYDGTDLLINTKEVGTGGLELTGDLRFQDNANFQDNQILTFGTAGGTDSLITFDGTDLFHNTSGEYIFETGGFHETGRMILRNPDTDNSGISYEFRTASYGSAFTFGGALSSELNGRFIGNSGGGIAVQGFSNNASRPGFRMQGHIATTTPTQYSYIFEAFRSDGSDGRTALTGTQKTYGFYNGAWDGGGTVILDMLADNSVRLPNDNGKLLLGAGDDFSITYNGSDGILNPKEVGTGEVIIQGDLRVTENVSVLNKLGIGTVNPESQMHIKHTGNMFFLEDTDDFVTWSFATGLNEAGDFGYQVFNSSLDYNPNFPVRIYSTQDGKIGINTKSPSLFGLEVNGSLNVTGNITGNFYYAEGWGHNIGDVVIASAGVYYPITNLSAGEINGFLGDSQNLTVLHDGVYSLDSSMSFSGTANNEYHISIWVNMVQQDDCHAERVIGTGADVGSAGFTCLKTLSAGDKVSVVIENMDFSNDATIHDINANIVRIGN